MRIFEEGDHTDHHGSSDQTLLGCFYKNGIVVNMGNIL